MLPRAQTTSPCFCLVSQDKECRFREPLTHLVTWFSTFTRGTGRARKSLETKVKCVFKRGRESTTWTLQAGRPKGGSCFLAWPPLQKGRGSFGPLTTEPCCGE